MLYPDKIADSFIKLVAANDYFDDKRVVKAYPEATKPTLLKHAVIAVGIKEINIDEASVGESVKRGSVSVFANIYIPFCVHDVRCEEVVSQICRAACDWSIISISASEMTADVKTQCRILKTVFTFNGEIFFGGDDDE